MFGRLTIRNLKVEIVERLNELASINERSVEAEVRYALAKWTELNGSEASVDEYYRGEISERLSFLIQQKNGALNFELKASHVAEKLGFAKGSIVEQWAQGEVEPTFEQLDALADYFSADPKWLKHGDGSPFDKTYIRIPEKPKEAIDWLLKKERYDDLINIAFIRDFSGCIYVVKIYENQRSIVYYTPYILDGSVGNGGFNSLCGLFVFWEQLYKEYTSSQGSTSLSASNIMIKSYIFDELDSQELEKGNIDPLALIKKQTDSSWWEDVWDKGDSRLREYWSGCRELCIKVNEHRR
ncbi:helix-turn-helix transcriptional regulator [Vibrio kanaloae]|uniref:Helix-turn-helix transcriptional regulator n=1 Tax=Vibrio kanaloae TaxID=170673 RepID=A0A4U1YY96_9VIBR|nr:helix-turn-helix transcriptional regulator [Vibrio kanaloae]TKF26653.1 helix-turn-helix transcriptional regulator [Vibrio kanaloae]